MLPEDKYYLTEVDKYPQSIYCYNNEMRELLIDSHLHKKHQFLYTEGGIVFVETASKTYYLPARHFMWIPAGIVHSIRTNREDAVMFNLYFPVEEQESGFYQEEGIYPVDDLLLQLMNYSKSFATELFPANDKFVVALTIKRILSEKNALQLPLALPVAKSERLNAILNFLHTEDADDLTYGALVRKFGFTERTLHRMFKRELEMSFAQYHTILKMIRAIELLLEKRFSVSEIASEVGYSSIATFSNTFYKFTGKRPSEYFAG